MRDFLDAASQAYYSGTPLISDAEFDILASHFNYDSVGHVVTNGIPHFYPMYSLQKVYSLEEASLSFDDLIITAKLDGAAISLLYVGGVLSLGLTRGDGKLGRDITDKVCYLVPNKISKTGVVQITGEVMAHESIPNARNYAAGALNLKDIEEFRSRELIFVAYDIVPTQYETYYESIEALEEEGFNTVIHFDSLEYPCDGQVYRLNSNREFTKLGYTAKHPRGAFALKQRKEGVVTTLLDVIWQVGKSGVVSPVAILEPVLIGDAVVSRATLHNIEYINNLELEIGCKVEIIRSGEIIPRVVRRVEAG